MKAWVVRREWIGNHAAVEKPLIAVLSARCSPDKVKDYVYFLYNYVGGIPVDERLAMARYNKPLLPAYIADYGEIDGVPWMAWISCGHNPRIRATLAEGAKAICGDDGAETIVWTERALPKKPWT